MFQAEREEAKSGRVVIPDVEFEAMRAIVQFMYNGKIAMEDVRFTVQVFVAADKYNVVKLKSACEAYLVEKMKVDEALVVIDLARQYYSPELANQAHNMFPDKRLMIRQPNEQTMVVDYCCILQNDDACSEESNLIALFH